MKFKSSRQRKAVMARIKNSKYLDFSEFTQQPKYMVEWSPRFSTKKHVRFFVNEKNAQAQAKDTRQHGGWAKINKI